eukprot:PhM_4_TR14629/c0_g1_i1/m.27954
MYQQQQQPLPRDGQQHTQQQHPDAMYYPAGGFFRVFSNERNQQLTLPSHYVFVTDGSERARQSGANSMLCRHAGPSGVCPRGRMCRFVHANVFAAQKDPMFRRTEVHKNDAAEIGYLRYETLPAGVILQVAASGNENDITYVPSYAIYKTKGAEAVYKMYPQAPAPRQHGRCSYFDGPKKSCTRGHDCTYLHIAHEDI